MDDKPLREPLEISDDERPKQQPLPVWLLVALTANWFGGSVVSIATAMIAMPSQVRAIVGNDTKTESLSYVVLCGAFGVLITAPIAGWISDRLRQRLNFVAYGTAGIGLFLILMAAASPNLPPAQKSHSDPQVFVTTQAMVNVTNATNTTVSVTTTTASGIMPSWGLAPYAVFVFGSQVCNVIVTTSFNGLMADVIPADARGSSSAVYAGSQALGNVVGAAVSAGYTTIGPMGFSVALAVFWLLTTAVTIAAGLYHALHYRKAGSSSARLIDNGHAANESESADEQESTARFVLCEVFGCRLSRLLDKDEHETEEGEGAGPQRHVILRILYGFVAPFRDRDFMWVFLTRLLMQLSVSTIAYFLEYYILDEVSLPDGMPAETGIAIAMVGMLSVCIVSAFGGGILSDKCLGGRRKALVILSCFIMGITSLLLPFIGRTLWSVCLLTGIFGLGYGCFLAVDFALVMDVLPNAHEKGRDLAVWHQALVLPNVIATPIAAAIKTSFDKVGCGQHCAFGSLGYAALFSTASVYVILAGIFVMMIKKVK